MTTRIGKIGRLPKGIREELGRRIEEGLRGNDTVQWLNAQAEVQAVLAQHFEGKAVTEQNLSDWKQGGHLDWVRRQEAREAADRLRERAEDLQAGVLDRNWSDRWAMVLTVEMQQVAAALVERETDPEKRWERLCCISKELSALRRDDHRLGRLVLQREQWEFAEERRLKAEKVRESQEKRERLQDMILEQQYKAKNAEMFGAKEAEMFYRLKFDLPMDDILDGSWEKAEEEKQKAGRRKAETKMAGEHSTLNIQRPTLKGARAWAEIRRSKAAEGVQCSKSKGQSRKKRADGTRLRCATARQELQRAKKKCAKRPMKAERRPRMEKSGVIVPNPSADCGTRSAEFQNPKAAENEQQSNQETKKGQKSGGTRCAGARRQGRNLQTEKSADRKMEANERMANEEWAGLRAAEEVVIGTGASEEVGNISEQTGNAPGRESYEPKDQQRAEAVPGAPEAVDPGESSLSQRTDTDLTDKTDVTDGVAGPATETGEAHEPAVDPKVAAVTEPKLTARERYYNTWFQMNRGSIPYDGEVLERLHAEAGEEEQMKNEEGRRMKDEGEE